MEPQYFRPSVSWEWFFGWGAAFERYFPKYAKSGSGSDCVRYSELQSSQGQNKVILSIIIF